MARSMSGPGPMAVVVDADITPSSNAALVAREMVVRAVKGIAASILEDALLIVSELVTNAVRHGPGGGPIHLQVRRNGVMRIEVQDPGAGFEPARAPREPGDLPTGGFGLVIVQRLSSDWGVATRGSPTSIWAELAL